MAFEVEVRQPTEGELAALAGSCRGRILAASDRSRHREGLVARDGKGERRVRPSVMRRTRPLTRPSLLLREDQVGLEFDLVVDLEEQQQLGHLHAVIGERGGELRLHLDVV